VGPDIPRLIGRLEVREGQDKILMPERPDAALNRTKLLHRIKKMIVLVSR
jgi:hypothetical protein